MTRSQKPGLRFKNSALWDMYLAFHSLLSEMASVRDYLAMVAARRIGAPQNLNGLSWLAKWINKPVNMHHANDPLVHTMLSVWTESEPDHWLFDLTAYRNLFLHREPLGTGRNRAGVRIMERTTPWGALLVFHFELAAISAESSPMDALECFADLHARLCRLSEFAATLAKYEPKVTHLEVRRSL